MEMEQVSVEGSDPNGAIAVAKEIDWQGRGRKRERLEFAVDELLEPAARQHQERARCCLAHKLQAAQYRSGRRIKLWRSRLPAPQPIRSFQPQSPPANFLPARHLPARTGVLADA